MVISQTPLRVSLLGGGTDFSDFFSVHGGAVLTMAIDKCVYVVAKERFDSEIYLNYSRKEIVSSVDQIQHELIRECMRKTGVSDSVEITTLADIPSEGSGLGSSSSITVGLLNALYAFRGLQVAPERLTEEACDIEIKILGKPIGVQDQAIAAHGNLCFIAFQKDGGIEVERLEISKETKRTLVSNLLLFYSDRTRKAESILREQGQNIPLRQRELVQLKELAEQGRAAILRGDLDCIGTLLHEAWGLKKSLANAVSDAQIDGMYDAALGAGALGGKIAGAGGGGFLLVYCPRDRQSAVRKALASYRELPFMLNRDGSRIIFNINT